MIENYCMDVLVIETEIRKISDSISKLEDISESLEDRQRQTLISLARDILDIAATE